MSYHVMLLSYWILISLIISHIFLLFSGMYFLLVHMVKPKYCIVSLVYGICVNKTHSTANYKKHYLCVLFKNIKSSHLVYVWAMLSGCKQSLYNVTCISANKYPNCFVYTVLIQQRKMFRNQHLYVLCKNIYCDTFFK